MAVQLQTNTPSQLINAANAAKLNIAMSATAGASAPFSINVWIFANWGSSGASTGRTSMVGIYGPSPTPSTALQIGSSTGSGELSCWTWGGGTIISTAVDFMSSFNNQWVNIGYTYNGTTHSLYLNGNLINTSNTAQLAGNLQMVCINGYPTGGSSETWNHIVDTYSLWNRMLTANEMLTIYNATGSRHGIINGQLCSYEFDEGVEASNVGASTVLDNSGNSLTLVLTGPGTAPKYTYTSSFADSNIRPVACV